MYVLCPYCHGTTFSLHVNTNLGEYCTTTFYVHCEECKRDSFIDIVQVKERSTSVWQTTPK